MQDIGEPEHPADPIRGAELSRRQLECLERAGEGMSSKQIGRELGISPSTVDNHIHAAVAKLHARNRWDAVRILDRNGHRTGPFPAPKERWLVPVGGTRNVTPARRRLLQILAIAILSTIALSAVSVLIMGALHVFASG